MRKWIVKAGCLLVLIVISASDICACTTFCLKNKSQVLFGKNYDWMIGDGLIFVNKRGVAKTSTEDVNPAKWVSKYGSVTFNQYGWESPSGGMNEAGLVIELMWLDDTTYPKADDRPVLDVLEWIQFNLDTAATTQEVIRNSANVRIASEVKLHYLVNDKSGDSATIEFLNGELVAHSGDDLPVAALTNDTYARSIEYSRDGSPKSSESSLDRFSRAATKSKDFDSDLRNEKASVDYAFDILKDVAQKDSTQWSIVYDQTRGRIYFHTRKQSGLKSIDAKAFDYACGTPVKILDIDLKETGDVTRRFKDYSRDANRDLIERSFRGTPFLRSVPSTAKDKFASFPEQFACAAFVRPLPIQSRQLVASANILRYLLAGVPLYHIYALPSS